MTKTLSFGNQKGGVGKTFLSMNTATILADTNFGDVNNITKVLLIDLDPQGNTTKTVMDGKPINKTIYDVFKHNLAIEDVIVKTEWKFDFVPVSVNLFDTEVFTSNPMGQLLLKTAITPIKEKYDFIVIDTPPTLNVNTVNAYIASDYIITPITPSPYALEGFEMLSNTIQRLQQLPKNIVDIKKHIVLMNNAVETEIATKRTEQELKDKGIDYLNTKIPSSTNVDKSLWNGQATVKNDSSVVNEALKKFIEELLNI